MSAVTDKITQYYANPANVADLAEKKSIFINALTERGIVIDACKVADIHRNTAYIWRNLDPEFRQAWDLALENATDVIEGSLYDNALKGNVIAQIFYLKNNRTKYRDKVAIDVPATQREVEERMQQLQDRMALTLPVQGLVLPDRSAPASTKDIINQAIGLSPAKQLVDPRD